MNKKEYKKSLITAYKLFAKENGITMTLNQIKETYCTDGDWTKAIDANRGNDYVIKHILYWRLMTNVDNVVME